MAADNMAAIQEALKIYYLPVIQYQLPTAAPLLAEMEKTSKDVVGSKIHMALKHGKHGGIGMIADDGDLPTPNARKRIQAKWDTQNIFLNIQVTDKAIEASKSNDGAFERILAADMEDGIDDMRDDLNRQLLGDGSCQISVIESASWASNVLTLVLTEDSWTDFWAEGIYVDIYDDSGSSLLTNGTNLEVTVVDNASRTLKLACTTDISSDIEATKDWLLRHGNLSHGELTGLGAVAAQSGTIYGLDRADYPFLKMVDLDVSGEISENWIKKGEHLVRSRAGGKIDFYMAALGVERAFADYLLASRQLVNPTLELKGGWEAVNYNNKPLVGEPYMKPGLLYGLQRELFKMYQMSEPNWMERDGNVLHRLESKPVWQATARWYADMGCAKIRGNACWRNITEH